MSGAWEVYLTPFVASLHPNLGTCIRSCASSGGSSWYLIMHKISNLGSSHISCKEGGSSERSEFTLSSIALARALAIGPSGVVGGVGASMGMIVGCSTSSPPLGKDPTSDHDPHHHGNGCWGRTCSWTELKTWRNPSSPRCRRSDRHAKRANTSNTQEYNG